MESITCKKWIQAGEKIDDYNCRLRIDQAFNLGLINCNDCPQFNVKTTELMNKAFFEHFKEEENVEHR